MHVGMLVCIYTEPTHEQLTTFLSLLGSRAIDHAQIINAAGLIRKLKMRPRHTNVIANQCKLYFVW